MSAPIELLMILLPNDPATSYLGPGTAKTGQRRR